MSFEDAGRGHIRARGLERRSVLKLAAGAAAVGAVGVGTSAPAHADVAPYNVIVIGAGFAGVAAARELRSYGMSPLILEARNRIGGRTWTDTMAGKRIELGGSWFSQHQSLVMKELRRYGLSLTPEGVAPQRTIFPAVGGGFRDLDALQGFAENEALMVRLFDGSRDYYPQPLSPLAGGAALRAADKKSLLDRLNELNLTRQERLLISSLTAGYSGGKSADGGLTALAAWWALPGHDVAGWNSLIGQVNDSGGTLGLLQRMLADAKAQLLYNSPVATVSDSGSSVTVTTRDGRSFTAPTAVVAVPANVWKDIRFSPGLPPVHQEVATQGSGVYKVTKFWIRVSGVPKYIQAAGQEGHPISALFSYYDLGGGQQMLIGFAEDPALNASDIAQLQPVVRQMLPNAVIHEVRASNWGTDQFARGGWALRRPGQLTRHLPDIQNTVGRLSFANDGIASGWVGFIDGAIETGVRAAQQASGRA
ncbi:flavin monoamine oxidase family protein [Streptomyces turgidiscabies]|uniref:Monoamine oxidase n=1 Tax=Streptomyces turgidiscabies TaxID=85558 RepID=A0ABU0RLH7_9ACTN|nr:NAD(P)/FAD-dependent oxidoreductase [Streptomyces turgidiscabies]MDQ0932819.1 monoamine oxidase [Streptomyces turgidiscabies]